MISQKDFLDISSDYNMIPIYEEIIIDIETPVSLYRRLAKSNDNSFLLESAKTGEHANRGRFSFIGISPEKIIKNTKKGVIVTNNKGEVELVEKERELIEFLNDYLSKFKAYNNSELPPFSGGLVGYFGYEMIEEWEELFHKNPVRNIKKSELPSSILVVAKSVIVYDHLNNTVKIINNVSIREEMNKDEKIKIYNKSKRKIKDLIQQVRGERGFFHFEGEHNAAVSIEDLQSNTSKKEFEKMVEQAKKYIKAGDVFQIVLSQKFSVETDLSPFQIYRALRVSNPSPYLFYLNFPEIKIIGSSPEVLVKVEEDKVITRPLAGTRPRGKFDQEDMYLKDELLSDEKEQAEHVMLVDLGRNDLGRVCQINSVEVTELMGVELFSQVMHIVSQVEGIKRTDMTSLDVLKAVFPAGTVSGAPKIRAMELIDDLERESRGIYAGAVGYLDFSGNLDTCITIRTFSVENNILTTQVGAGMVADSVPEKEYQETLNKARALFKALEITKKEEPYGLSY